MTILNRSKILRRPVILAVASALLAGSAVAGERDAQAQARDMLSAFGRPTAVTQTLVGARRVNETFLDAQAQAQLVIAAAPSEVTAHASVPSNAVSVTLSGPEARGSRHADAQQRAQRLIMGTAG